MLNIRPMKLEDVQAVTEIARDCFSDPWSSAAFQDVFRYSGNYYFVAEKEEMLCGFAGILVSADTADIMNLGVTPKLRGGGIAKQLLHRILEQAVQCGCVQVLLEVRESNQIARMLYENSGFEQIAVRKNYYTKPVEDGIVMQKYLKKKME